MVASMRAGRERWLARMQDLKAAGMIKKIPGGRRPRAPTHAKASDMTVIEEARAVVVRDHGGLPALSVLPWQDQSHPEKLHTLTGKALDKTREILDLPCDAGNLKLLAIQKDAALSILSAQVKVDENRLRQQENGDRLLAELLRLIEEEKAKGTRQTRLLKIGRGSDGRVARRSCSADHRH